MTDNGSLGRTCDVVFNASAHLTFDVVAYIDMLSYLTMLKTNNLLEEDRETCLTLIESSQSVVELRFRADMWSAVLL